MMDNQDSNDEIQSMAQKFEAVTTIANVTASKNVNPTTKLFSQTISRNSPTQVLPEVKKTQAIEADDNTPVRSVPEQDVPERIILIIDVTKEPDCTQFKLGTGAKYMPMFMINRVVEIFLNAKSMIKQSHEFALVTLNAKSVKWYCDFTSNIKTIINSMDTLTEEMLDDDVTQSSFDLSPLFELIWDHTCSLRDTDSADSMPSVVRAILIYSRSHCIPRFQSGRKHFDLLSDKPYFVLDALFVHEPPSSENKCEEVYEELTTLDAKNLSYILEVGRNATKLHDNMAKLLAHPLQRPLQENAAYNINIPEASEEMHTNV